MIKLSRYDGSPNIGVFAIANENISFVASNSSSYFMNDLQEALGVDVKRMTLLGSTIIGSLIVMNSNGALLSGLAGDDDLSKVSIDIPCMRLDDPLNAVGNNILANDKGAIINPLYNKKVVETISDFLKVECIRSSIAGYNTVGSICKATNCGCVCHTNASDDEIDLISDILKVETIRTSVNHGSCAISAGIIANSKGAIIGDKTTSIEINRVEDGLLLY